MTEHAMNQNEPYQWTASRALELMRSGELTAEAYLASCLGRIHALEDRIGAWACLDEASALNQARELDRDRRRGAGSNALFGIPVGIKDIFNTRDLPTCMGSPIWAGFTPGNDARVVHELRRSGAVIPGKTVTAEFAVHHPGRTVNPHHPEHTPGTSSSGSAAAVATGMVPLALGTQTAGSTIRPASFCGIYGFKPSFGLVPRTGILKTLDTLDHVSFLARSVEDIALVFETARVHGRNYPYVYNLLENPEEQRPGKPWRVAFVRTYVWPLAEVYVKEAMLDFAARLSDVYGVEVVETELPGELEEAHAVHNLVYEGSLAYYFREEYQSSRERLSPVFRRMVERGREISPERLKFGFARQNALARRLDRFLSDFDVVLTYSTAHEAPEGLHTIEQKDPCLIWTLCRAPSMNLPLFVGPKRLPFGAQLVARRYRDYKLLRFVSMLRDRGLSPEGPYPRGVME